MTATQQAARAALSEADRDLVDLYAPEYPQHAWSVVAAFVLADREPPHNMALTSKDSKIVQEHYAKYDPNGARAQNARIDSELGE